MIVNMYRLQLAIAKRKLSNAELSKLSNVSAQTIASIMSGKPCRPKTIGLIAEALHVLPEYLTSDN